MTQGLSATQAAEKLQLYGKNKIQTKQKKTALTIFFSQLPSLLNGILFIAAGLSLFLKDILDAFFILAVIFLNALVGFIQEYRAEKSLEKLTLFITPVSRVIRDGNDQEIPSEQIVPGDVVILSEGDRIPADGSLHTQHDIEVDESILSGESLAATKLPHHELYSGTLVTKGNGQLLVEKTGMQTRFGKIADTLSTLETDKSPLQKQLIILGRLLSLATIFFAFIIIPIGMLQNQSLSPLILLAISIGVAVIPEGLPTVVTAALAIGTSRMAAKNAIVRQMSAVETLGAMQVVLIDKTGTLTQNTMRVKKHWYTNDHHKKALLRACVLGNTASVVKKANTADFDVLGDKTDGALLLFAHEHVPNFEEFKTHGTIVAENAFDPETKTISTEWEESSKRYVFVRGAPELVLAKCQTSEREKEEINSVIQAFAKEGLRVIGFGMKGEKHTGKINRDHLENHLFFLGLVGIHDPPRKEALHAVKEAKQAGIHTVMVTGDNELTALAIAKDVGLIEQDEDVVTSQELEKMTDTELKAILFKTRIFARVNPEDKLRLTQVFKQLGYVVGVTGDGVNDALALKRADVGIAMGEKGTDVAKEASDIVLTDDNFATLVKAIEEGRVIYNNIVKSITYLLSGNLSELSLIVFATLFGIPSPLLPTQILWINLVTDSLPALALASDNKDPDLLKQKPRSPSSPLLGKQRLLFIGLIGVCLSLWLLLVFNTLRLSFTETFARTVTVNLLVLSHMAIAFLVRGGAIFRPNMFLVLSVGIILTIQVLITFLPFFQPIFHFGFY